MTPGYESSQTPNLTPTIAPTPEDPSGSSLIPSRSVTTLQQLSAEILEAIESQHWEALIKLVKTQTLISKWWWVQDKDIPANYRSSKGECLSGFHIIFDNDYEDKIGKAVSMEFEGNLPVHRLTKFITKAREDFEFEQVKRSVSILSGVGRPEKEHWRQKNAEGKNALHIAASGQGRNSEHALRALLELMAVSASDDGLAGLDDQTMSEDMNDNTALHLAALNIPKTALHLSGNHESTQPFNRLLLAGANPWIQNRFKDTVLHLLNKDKQGKENDERSTTTMRGKSRDNAEIQNVRDNMRIQGALDILQQQGDWKSHLVAVNLAGNTAMSLALSTKDYKMVAALATAHQTPSFVQGKEEEDTWSRDGAAAFDVAVFTRDTDLDSMRGNLIRSLAEDKFVKKCFNERDEFGLTALHKVCNLKEDRDDIVMALLRNGAKVRKRVGQPAQEQSKEPRRYTGWSALSFALKRGHRWTVSLLLANGAMDGLTPAECSDIKQRSYEEGDYIGWDLIQYFRTHVSDSFSEVLERPQESKKERKLEFLATKWPSKGMMSDDADEEGESRYRFKDFEFETFDYRSYPEKRSVRHMLYCNDDTTWDTWTRRNGGWIHLPANNVSFHHLSLTREVVPKTNIRSR